MPLFVTHRAKGHTKARRRKKTSARQACLARRLKKCTDLQKSQSFTHTLNRTKTQRMMITLCNASSIFNMHCFIYIWVFYQFHLGKYLRNRCAICIFPHINSIGERYRAKTRAKLAGVKHNISGSARHTCGPRHAMNQSNERPGHDHPSCRVIECLMP